MTRLHHVNVSVPHGRGEMIATFYCDVLGFSPIARPDNGRDGVWLAVGDGTQLHLSERDGTAPAKQHFAIVVDDLAAVRDRLAAIGAEYEPGDDVFETGGRGFTRDPAGNRVELIASGS